MRASNKDGWLSAGSCRRTYRCITKLGLLAQRDGRDLTPETVRLHHFARFAEWIRSARMLVMQQDRKLWSYGFTLGRYRFMK
jgi:hypothetical protein